MQMEINGNEKAKISNLTALMLGIYRKQQIDSTSRSSIVHLENTLDNERNENGQTLWFMERRLGSLAKKNIKKLQLLRNPS